MSKSELQAAALQASMDAQRLEGVYCICDINFYLTYFYALQEAAMKRTAARKLQEAAMHVEEGARQSDSDEGDGDSRGDPVKEHNHLRLDDERVGGPASAAPPDELLTPGDECDSDTSSAANAHAENDINSRYSPKDTLLGSVNGLPNPSRGIEPSYCPDGQSKQESNHGGKAAEEREQARATAEAESKAKMEAEEREQARAKAEAERKAKEAEERESYRKLQAENIVSSPPARADESEESPKRSDLQGKPSLSADWHRPTGSPSISTAVSPKDAFAERKAALLAEAGSIKRDDEDDLRRKAQI